MKITQGSVSAEVEYTQHEDGTWSFKLTLDGDPVPIESNWNFATQELAKEEVEFAMEAATLRRAEG